MLQISPCFSSGQEDHHEVAAAGGFGDVEDLEAVLFGLGAAGGIGPQADHDVDAGVLEVEGMRVALGAVAEDRDGLAVELAEVGVFVVEDVVGFHGRAGYRSGPSSHQLARRRAWQRRGELDPLRHLEAGERLGAVAAQLVRGHLRAAFEHDDRGHRLLPLGVLAADHGGVGHLGVAQQHLLDLGRDDVLAAADDQVVEPVLDVEEAFLIDFAEVAGVQPAVGVGAAGGDGRSLDQDLAVGGDPQVGGEQRPAGGAELAARVGGRQRRHLRAGLGEAVGLDHGRALGDRLFQRLLRDRAAADQDRPRAGEVGAGLEQAGQHRRHQRDDRDPVLLAARRRRGRRRSRRGRPRWSRR